MKIYLEKNEIRFGDKTILVENLDNKNLFELIEYYVKHEEDLEIIEIEPSPISTHIVNALVNTKDI